MKKRIIILGNGFDLFLGHKTKYSDFLKWLKIKNTEVNNLWINFYLKNIEVFENYSLVNFEKNLANILNHEKERNEVVVFWNSFSNNEFSKNIIEKVIYDWENFTMYFLKYLDLYQKPIKISRDNNYWLNNKFFIINFNFTNNLILCSENYINSFSKYYEKQYIPNIENLFGQNLKKSCVELEKYKIQIHGNLNTGILGSDEIKNNDYLQLKKEFKKYSINIDVNKVSEFFEQNFYDEIIINILGHSICSTDKEIYEKIINKDSNNDFLWIIFYYDKSDLNMKKLNLFKLNKSYFEEKQKLKKIEYKNFQEWERDIF